MAHAPILVPEVAGERAEAARDCCQSMRQAAASLAGFAPQSVVLISPHSPRRRGAFGVWGGERLSGSLAQFNAPSARVRLPNDVPLAEAIAAEARKGGLATWEIDHESLDHGATVPLWFLAEAGWSGPTVVLGLNYPDEGGLTQLGEAITAAARGCQRRIALVASGDMSHRLKPNAPAGFHPRAHQFDEAFIQVIREGDYHRLGKLDADLREIAAEDAVDSTWVAAAAVEWQATGHRVLHYEGPFGVGYGVAILFADASGACAARPTQAAVAAKHEGEILPEVARRSMEAALNGGAESPPPPTNAYLRSRNAVFVTLHERGGKLRGCAGTILPYYPDVVTETWHSARLAAFRDSRFNPVEARELPKLHIDVSVLHSMEKIDSASQLNPAQYGVIVSTGDGRRGLLLPALPDITTVEQQMYYARRKALIGPDEPVHLQRFQVDYFSEESK